MANKIGNYIHFKYSSYEAQGLSRQGGSAPNPTSVWKKQKQTIKTEFAKKSRTYKSGDIAELEKQLNYFYAWGKPGASEVEKLWREAIEEAVKNAYNRPLRGRSFNFDNMTTIGAPVFYDVYKRFTDDEKKYLSSALKIKPGLRTKITNIDKNMAIIRDMRAKIPNNSTGNLGVLMNRMDNLLLSWKQITNSAKKGRKTIDTTSGVARNFIEEMQFVLFYLKCGGGSTKGDIAEFIQYCVNYFISNKSAEGFLQLGNMGDIHNSFLQQKRNTSSQKGVLKVNIDNNISWGMKTVKTNSRQKINEDFGLFTMNLTENKVDLNFDISGGPVPLSLKNYNLASNPNLHLLSGSSLLALVQDYNEFVNHYLNIVPLSVIKEEEEKSISNVEANKNRNESLRKAFHETMKLTILLKAARGGVWGMNAAGSTTKSAMADFFIVNDSSNQNPYFKVYDFSTIFNTVEKNLSLLKTGEFDNINHLENIWQKEKERDERTERWHYANDRIANLLMQMHQMKLNVSINKAALKIK